MPDVPFTKRSSSNPEGVPIMLRKWRLVVSVWAGLLTGSGGAWAQSPAPQPLPPLPPVPAVSLTADVQPVSAPPAVHPAGGGVTIPTVPAPVPAPARLAAAVRSAHQPIPYAQHDPGCNNGCGSCRATLGFVFGSCPSFFDPCGPRPCCGPLCQRGGLGCQRCGIHPFGQPYAKPHSGCVYDSYLNH